MDNKIGYPGRDSEAEIQATLWHELRQRNIDARLQVPSINPLIGRRSWRLDVVVFVDKEPKCIIECKSWSDGYSRSAFYRTNNTGQIKKYKNIYGLPVLICARMSFIPVTVKMVEEVINSK